MQHGLAELVAYLDLAASDRHCAFDENQPQLVQWQDASGTCAAPAFPDRIRPMTT